ncbi:hypothetical protein [Hyperthermus butylicus]|uniref:hypothetical protein n=1 Tax=Hyperthermus butylicus TaxID=54248 RepID=UPI000326AF12|nr:hypothetical protein [Hyperthermus butylicus]
MVKQIDSIRSTMLEMRHKSEEILYYTSSLPEDLKRIAMIVLAAGLVVGASGAIAETVIRARKHS